MAAGVGPAISSTAAAAQDPVSAADTAGADTARVDSVGAPAAGVDRPGLRGIQDREELARRLERLLADPALARAHVGLTVQVAETGEVLFDRAGEKRFTAASTAKLVTAAVALQRLGTGHRWTTTLAATGPVRQGVLEGDLWVVGSGDPSVTEDRLRSWAGHLRDAGIRRITGDVVGDDRAFESPAWGRGWMWNDLHLGWAAGVSGLQVDPGTISGRLHPGAEPGVPATLRLDRPTEHLPVDYEVRTGTPGSNLRLRLDPHRPEGPTLVRGWIASDADPLRLRFAPTHPTLLFLERLDEALGSAGVTVDGELRRPTPEETPPGGGGDPVTGWRQTFRSDSLGALLSSLLRPSDNQMAESLLRTMGRERGREGSAREGLEVVDGVLSGWGVAPGAVALADGSGLSRYDALAPAALVRVLRAAWRQPWYPVFRDALPAPRESGTLRGRFMGIPAEESVRAKTGSLGSVRGLAGYVQDGDGETLLFTLLINGYDVPGDTATALRDLLVEQLTLYHRAVEPGWPRQRDGGGSP